MDRKLGPYELRERLAVGGLAEIYLARKQGMLGFEQRYALKVLLPQYADSEEHRKRMIDEARLTAQLDHPNIIKVHDLSSDDDTLFMVMEYVNGLDLSQLTARLRRAGELMPIPAAIWMTQEICAGLHYAHTRTATDGTHLRIVHRDVSPQNVLLGYGGEVKLIDFGVAKAVGGGRLETKTGIIKGKLSYMAPEYAVGSQQDNRSDTFAAALCLFEMLTGEPAYRGEPSELIELIKTASVPAPSSIRGDVPAELDDIVARATQRNPNDRFPTAQDFQRTLASLQARIASNFNRERFAAWLAAVRRKTDGPNRSPKSETKAEAPASPEPTPPLDDDMREDDFAELATMAIENPLDTRATTEDFAVAATGPMEQETLDEYEDEDDELAGMQTISLERPDAGAGGADSPAGPSDSDDELARMPTADLNVADIDPSRLETATANISTDDVPTATDIDVKAIRGLATGDAQAQILSQSGFQRFVSTDELAQRNPTGGQRPPRPSDESTSPSHRVKPVEPAGIGEDSDAVDTVPPGAVSTSDVAQFGNTGGRGIVTPGGGGSETETQPGDANSGDEPDLDSSHRGPSGGWDFPEPPPKKTEGVGRTAEGLARKFTDKYSEFSRTERGRRTVHAWIVGVLAILFVGLIVYVFFLAGSSG